MEARHKTEQFIQETHKGVNRTIRTKRSRHKERPDEDWKRRQNTTTYRIPTPKRHPEMNVFQKNNFFQDH